ncbi:hypothetical protein CC78DRAFT_570572 [Lojkania enalia]|uniref:Uncharacterized protein n=1 Tax=Lojkania enalia TaxID=147567 RepID=A0A9P4N1C5_9PLEO|nr:hypothetical protein CC78DRAFT_570572 [Didymosphaeria enalia]
MAMPKCSTAPSSFQFLLFLQLPNHLAKRNSPQEANNSTPSRQTFHPSSTSYLPDPAAAESRYNPSPPRYPFGETGPLHLDGAEESFGEQDAAPYAPPNSEAVDIQNSDALPRNLQEALQHLRTPKWIPISGSHSVPHTAQDRLEYVNRVADALQNVSSVLDGAVNWRQMSRFLDGGVWTREDVYATAHVVVDMAVRMHTIGAVSMTFKDPDMQPDATNAGLTFSDRMEWFCMLVKEFKGAADVIMHGRDIEEFLAGALSSQLGYERRYAPEIYQARRNPAQQSHRQFIFPASDPIPTVSPYILAEQASARLQAVLGLQPGQVPNPEFLK